MRSRLLDRWFEPVRLPHEAARDLAPLAARGSLVFVMRSAGVLNFLFLAWVLRRWRLPPLRTALGLTGVMPGLARVRASRAALEDAVSRGESAVVFLGRARGPDPFPLLVELQRQLGRPVLLVPALLVWTRRPQTLAPTLGELFFGTPGAPSRFANAVGFILNRQRAVFRLGRASDLAVLVSGRAAEPGPVLGRKVRGALHLHLAGQMRAIVGPPLKSPSRVRRSVLRDKGLRLSLERQSRECGRSLQELQREAERDLREIASRYSPSFIEVLRPIVGGILHRLYEAVDVDEEGLARVKRAMAEAPVVFCPSHKSHVDYLLLSWLLYEHGMTPPHIAAGINLSFWPFGSIARRGGAFFIRRTLRGDRVYTATLRAYVKQLLRDRFPQQFYLEGGRSRSGKLLFPKTGLFSMEVDAWVEEAAHDILFVPVAVDYEVLLESGSYARELAGAEKSRENLGGLIRAGKVLRRRYGRLSIQFEEPISLRQLAERRLGERASLTLAEEGAGAAPELAGPDGAAESRRQLVQSLANRVAYGVTRAVSVTPVGVVAASLLAHLRRGLPAPELAQRVELLRAVARQAGARFSRGLGDAPADPLVAGPVAEAVARLAKEGLVRIEQAAGRTVYQPVEERRPLLDYHKNAVLHVYVPLALVAASLRAAPGATRDEVKERALSLSRLLKLEFIYRVGASFDETFTETATLLERLGASRTAGDRLVPGSDPGALEFLAELLRPYLEAYRLAFEALLALDREDPGAGIDGRSLVRAALEQGRAAYATGQVAAREAVSKATLENAAEWLFQQGALVPGAGGRARLAASWRDRRLGELVENLRQFLHD